MNHTPDPMSLRLKLSLGAFIVVSILGLTVLLVSLWPGPEPSPLAPESRYLVCAAAAGALGSFIHLASSFIEHAGRGQLRAEWAWWYFLRPWIGSALALVVYFVVRAGLITGAGDAGVVNAYGVAAMAALSGMFSHQATEKLRNLFENLCAIDRKTSSD